MSWRNGNFGLSSMLLIALLIVPAPPALAEMGNLSSETADEYDRLMYEATQIEGSSKSEPSETATSRSSSGGSSTGAATVVGSGYSNQTAVSDAGYGTDIEQPPQPSVSDDYVDGYKMVPEIAPETGDSGPMSFPGSDTIGAVLVLLAIGTISIGFRRRKA